MSKKRRQKPRTSQGSRTAGGTAPKPQPGEPEFLRRRPKLVATQETDWMPLPAIMAVAVVGFAGYIIAEAALAPFPHPSHWLAAAVGAVLGYVAGLIWHRTRGFN